MRQPGTFWGVILIGVGLFLLLTRMGLMTPALLRLIAPLALVGFGVWLLWAATRRPDTRLPEPQALSFQLKGAEEATVRLRFGAGQLLVGGGAAPDELLSGHFSAGVEQSSRISDEQAMVTLSTPSAIALPFGILGDQVWNIRLNESLPLHLDLELGGGVARLDLSATQVRSARLSIAAGRVDVTPPAAGSDTALSVSVTGGEVSVTVPPDVVADIRADALAGHVNVDTARFPRSGHGYRSPDYDVAAHRLEMRLETVAGSILVR